MIFQIGIVLSMHGGTCQMLKYGFDTPRDESVGF